MRMRGTTASLSAMLNDKKGTTVNGVDGLLLWFTMKELKKKHKIKQEIVHFLYSLVELTGDAHSLLHSHQLTILWYPLVLHQH